MRPIPVDDNDPAMSSAPIPGLIEPIRLSTRVRRDLNAAFDLFTGDISAWWPLDRFTHGPGRSKEVFIEPFVGGRFFERFSDGEEFKVGDVLVWERPTAVVFTWMAAEWIAPTEVSVRFIAEDTIVTRVEVEHRAWERLGDLGWESREQYANGWPTVVGCYADHAGTA
jgi:hypothetical protein